MRKRLTKQFFERSAPEVARDLLGKYLVREVNGKMTAAMITETEAYEGLEDLASHASKGRTERTEVMFGEPGRFYVYFIYGMYSMLNVVTGKKGHPAGVLIRSTDAVRGPGRLTRMLGVTRALYGKKASRESGLWFEDRGISVRDEEIQISPRIGVDFAGPVWSKHPWRFIYNARNNS